MLIDVLRAGQKQGFEEGFELHIAHLGNADMLPLIKAAKADGEGCRMRNSCSFCCLGGQQENCKRCVLLHAAACRRRYVCCAESAKTLSHFWERGRAELRQFEAFSTVK